MSQKAGDSPFTQRFEMPGDLTPSGASAVMPNTVTQRFEEAETFRSGLGATERFEEGRRESELGLNLYSGIQIAGRYTIEDGPIGDPTGEAEIYRGKDDHTTTQVAIKIYRKDLSPKLEVIESLSRMKHPGIVRLLDHGNWHGHFFEVMEYCEGDTLVAYVPFEEKMLCAHLPVLVDALHLCHKAGIIHRDIKPTNLFFRKPDRQEPVISDFGISSHMEDRGEVRHTTSFHLTADYAAPELLENREVGPKTDWYGLGITLIHLLRGKSPFAGMHPMQIAIAHSQGQIPIALQWSEEIRKLLKGLTQVDHVNRWGYTQIRAWLENKQVLDDTGRLWREAEGVTNRPYPGYREAGTPRELASCLDKFDAKKQLFRGDIRRWVFDHFSSEMAEQIERIEEEETDHPEAGLAQLRYLLDPSLPLIISKKALYTVNELLGELDTDDQNTLTSLEHAFRTLELDYWISNQLEEKEKKRVLEKLTELRADPSRDLLFFRIGQAISPGNPIKILPKTILRCPGDLQEWLARDPEAVNQFGQLLADGRLLLWLDAFKENQSEKSYIESLLNQYGTGDLAVRGAAWRVCPEMPLLLGIGVELRSPKDLGMVWQGNPDRLKLIVNAIESGLLEIWLESAQFLGWEEDVAFIRQATGNSGKAGASRITKRSSKEWHDPVTGMEFILIPGGTFQMGDLFGDGDSNEKPVHSVTLEGYWLAKYPVTQGQWMKIMRSNPSYFKKGDDYPVEQISWNDIQKFIKKLNAKGDGKFRLPTEAEWEYAARSGGKVEKYAGGDNIDLVAWYSDNSGSSTHQVGTKIPNGLGLYDMSGNVYEWVQDVYAEDAYSKHDSKGIYAGSKSARVFRGGCWRYGARSVRCANRTPDAPDFASNLIGSRIAKML